MRELEFMASNLSEQQSEQDRQIAADNAIKVADLIRWRVEDPRVRREILAAMGLN